MMDTSSYNFQHARGKLRELKRTHIYLYKQVRKAGSQPGHSSSPCLAPTSPTIQCIIESYSLVCLKVISLKLEVATILILLLRYKIVSWKVSPHSPVFLSSILQFIAEDIVLCKSNNLSFYSLKTYSDFSLLLGEFWSLMWPNVTCVLASA